MKKIATALIAALVLGGCALPNSAIKSGSNSQPTLAVTGAPANAALFVDGLHMGSAADYNGVDRVLSVLEGVHDVKIKRGDTVIHSEKILAVAGETRVIKLNDGGQ